MTSLFYSGKLFSALLLSFAASVALGQTKSVSLQPFTIPSSEVRTIHSDAVGADFPLFIHYPDGYDTATFKMPVLFILDGENDFAPALEYLGLLRAECGIREPLLIAIGEGGSIGSEKNKRARDYTPTSVTQIRESGGAPAFLRFIETELIPFVEENYKTDPAQRSMYGYSLGGLFTSYLLFHKPGLFQNVLIGSPALWFDNEIVLSYESEYAKKNADLPANVFCEVGALEGPNMIEPNKKLVQALQSRGYKNLKIKSMILEGLSHFTGKPSAMLNALAFAYCKNEEKKMAVQIPVSKLQKYTGVYTLNKDQTITVTLRDGKLYGQASSQKYPQELVAESETSFYVPGEDIAVTFYNNQKEEVTHFVLRQQGKTHVALKNK